MVKQPFYCGEDQKKYYQETKQKADRDKMNPVYKRFFDIEDSVKANRLETRERAIANGWDSKIDESGHVVSDDAAQTKHNFHYNLWEMEKGGAKTRYQWNMDAIRTLKQIESENRLATPEEQKVLSKFVGWGGLSQAFDEENTGWSKEYAELKELLSDEEYSAARATVNNAFYTSPEIAMCINSALVQFGFRGGNVLEPSMGIGNFFGSMPETMHEAKLYGVELDSISGRIAKQLYQNANISITGFENTTYPDNFFDVVVGNNLPRSDKYFDNKYSHRKEISCKICIVNTLISMQIEQFSDIKSLVTRLKSDPVFRRSLGYDYFENMPSEATLNCFIKTLAESDILEKTFRRMVSKARQLGLIDGTNVAIDASKLTAYEHAVPKSKIPSDDSCFPNWGGKLDTNGNFIKWFGWKMHALVDTYSGLPISYIITPANIADMDVAEALIQKMITIWITSGSQKWLGQKSLWIYPVLPLSHQDYLMQPTRINPKQHRLQKQKKPEVFIVQ